MVFEEMLSLSDKFKEHLNRGFLDLDEATVEALRLGLEPESLLKDLQAFIIWRKAQLNSGKLNIAISPSPVAKGAIRIGKVPNKGKNEGKDSPS